MEKCEVEMDKPRKEATQAKERWWQLYDRDISKEEKSRISNIGSNQSTTSQVNLSLEKNKR